MNDALLLRAHLHYDRYIQNEERLKMGLPLEYANAHLLSKVKIKNSTYKGEIGILSDIKGKYISVIIHKNKTFKVEGLLEDEIELISRNAPEDIVENADKDFLFNEYLQYVMQNDFEGSIRKLNYVYRFIEKIKLTNKNVYFVDFERKRRIV